MERAISVTKFNSYIKQIFDSEELLHNISIVGEVFGVSLSRNVIYFSLKDENASLSCVSFYPNLIEHIIEGQKVIITGSPNYYQKTGKLNFNVIKVEPIGQGKLYEEFLKLKDKLEKEGLFSPLYKKPMPTQIKRIGVITSSEGAVLQDIKNIAWRRNPSVDIVLFNTKVQGNLAEKEIAHAIDVMGKYDKIDVIIVARGGGSLEDLAAYNTEEVARAVFNCPKFLVSAVGHETDYTIIDFVSDLRAPTPSAAAELLTYDVQNRRTEIGSYTKRIVKTISDNLTIKTNTTYLTSIKLINQYEKLLIEQANYLKKHSTNMISQTEAFLNQKFYELGLKEIQLKKNNPYDILKKGYAKIEQGQNIKSIESVDFSKDLSIILIDGKIIATPKLKEKKDEINKISK